MSIPKRTGSGVQRLIGLCVNSHREDIVHFISVAAEKVVVTWGGHEGDTVLGVNECAFGQSQKTLSCYSMNFS